MNKPESIQKFEMDMKEALSLGCGNKTNTMTKTFNDFLDEVAKANGYKDGHFFRVLIANTDSETDAVYEQAAELYAAYRFEEAGKCLPTYDESEKAMLKRKTKFLENTQAFSSRTNAYKNGWKDCYKWITNPPKQ